MKRLLVYFTFFIFVAITSTAQVLPLVAEQTFDTTGIPNRYEIPKKMQWWYDARFGMFIHFGSYSYYGHGEWCMFVENWNKKDYQEQITKNFNPKKFNAKQIVSYAKKAGMKYIVITAKHHEGFCMWETQVEDFKDYTNTKIFDLKHYLGFQRDLLMELKNECDRQGIHFGLYYSILDWNHHSQYHKDYWSQLYSIENKVPFIEAEKQQIKELVERYHPEVLWFDGDWCENKDSADVFNWWTKQDAVDLYNYIMSLDSTIIVNERIKRNMGLGDFMCPEEKIPSKPLQRPWETCRTMNGAWGYDKSKNSPDKYMTADQIFEELFKTVSRDGNYLLNIGPTGNGSLSKGDITTLRNIGKLMDKYGDAIYGTNRNPFSREEQYDSTDATNKYLYTIKKDKLYCYSRVSSGDHWTPYIKIQHPESEKHTYTAYELSNPNQNIHVMACVNLKDTTIKFRIPNWNDMNYDQKSKKYIDRTNRGTRKNKPIKKDFEIIVIECQDFTTNDKNNENIH